MNRRQLALAAFAATLAVAGGTAAANANTADATCDGLAFNMARSEAGTVVTTRLDGNVVRTDTVGRQFDPVAFNLPSPDRTRQHTWSITIDSVWNQDQSWSETVPACATPTTTTPATAPTTTSAPPSTVAPTTTVVAVTEPPAPAPTTTVVTPPRATTTTTPPASELPATGSTTDLTLILGALAAGTGCMLLIARRRPS